MPEDDALVAWTYLKKQLDQVCVLIKDSQVDATPDVFNEARDILKQIEWAINEVEKKFILD